MSDRVKQHLEAEDDLLMQVVALASKVDSLEDRLRIFKMETNLLLSNAGNKPQVRNHEEVLLDMRNGVHRLGDLLQKGSSTQLEELGALKHVASSMKEGVPDDGEAPDKKLNE